MLKNTSALKIAGIVLSGLLSWLLVSSHAHAAVEINSADQAALESVQGLGPSKAKAILAERKKNGPFKDSADLQSRVKGIGEKTVERLMGKGLIINGQSNSTVGSSKKVKATAKDLEKTDAPAKSTRQRKAKEDKKE
jgi:competence protein ComEA